MRFLLTAIFFALTAPAAFAQSSLGFSGFEVNLSAAQGDDRLRAADLRATVNVTGVHGLQLDISMADYGPKWRGAIAGHLFMAPSARAKYGLFAAMIDSNESSATEYAFGAEVIAQCGKGCAIEARGGIGGIEPYGHDYIFARLGGRYALSRRSTLKAAMDVIDMDELAFRAREIKVSAGVEYALMNHLTLDLGFEHAKYSGTSSGSDTRAVIGLTSRFGAQPTPFSTVRPLDGLLAHNAVPLTRP